MSSNVPSVLHLESCVVHAINQIILLKCAEVLLVKMADHGMVLTSINSSSEEELLSVS